MKKIICLLMISGSLYACNSQESTSDDSSGPSTTNVQNVNGNQPDTSTGITLDNNQRTDSSGKDSLRR